MHASVRNISKGQARMQVYCLKALRAIESGHGIDPTYRDYKPDDPAVKALLTRDISSAMKDPYKAAVEDCLIITMKVLTSPPGLPGAIFAPSQCSLYHQSICLKHAPCTGLAGDIMPLLKAAWWSPSGRALTTDNMA